MIMPAQKNKKAGSPWLPAVVVLSFSVAQLSSRSSRGRTLAVTTATVSAAPTVETAAAVKSTANRATVESTTTTNCSTAAVSSGRTARITANTRVAVHTDVASPAVVPVPAVVAVSVAPAAPTPWASPAIPRTSPDKHSPSKPTRSVVAVRRAGVRIISIVAVGANRSCANAYPNRDLRLRISQRQHQNRDQSQIFHVPHNVPPCL